MYTENYKYNTLPDIRSEKEIILRQSGYFANNSLLDIFTGTVSDFLIVMNEHRQIVFVNKVLLNHLKLGMDKIIGLMPGELLGCMNAFETPAGCGTSRLCRTCGAAMAMLNTQNTNDYDIQECCLFSKDKGQPLNFRVRTTPLAMYGENFIIAAFSDISHELRRRSLEKIFFHDVLNTATGLLGVSELIRRVDFPRLEKLKDRLSALTDRLIYEVESQRELSAAENNELTINLAAISLQDFVAEIIEMCSSYDLLENKSIRLSGRIPDMEFTSDRTLLRRVLVNMIKNAIEASADDSLITIGIRRKADSIVFSVHNGSYIPGEVQLKIFQRAFSTKEKGRGLGTYSMKLLTERYLKGQICFTTSKAGGTTFTACFPLKIN